MINVQLATCLALTTYYLNCKTTTMMLSQAVELGDTGRQVVLWVAMGLALWQLTMFAASTLVQGKNLYNWQSTWFS